MSSLDPPPARVHEHQCVCNLIKNDNGEVFHDKCMKMVRNPDQPFCDMCEDQGHADLRQASR
jgi:hypothetical protein